MTCLKMNRKELSLVSIVIIGIVTLFISLITTIYISTTNHSKLVFRNDAQNRSSDLDDYLSYMETTLSVFISNVEEMRINNFNDREVVVKMQTEMLKKHTDVFGISLIYEPNAYDGLDESYMDDYSYNENGVFMPHVLKMGDTFEVKPFHAANDYSIYENVKNTGLSFIEIGTCGTTVGIVSVLNFYIPIFDDNGIFIGMGGINYKISLLTGYLEQHIFNNMAGLMIIDKNGEIVASSSMSCNNLISMADNIAEFSAASLNEIQYIDSGILAKNSLMVITTNIMPQNEYEASLDGSQFSMVHIAERQTLFGFLITNDASVFNMFVAVITIISFFLLLVSFSFRKRKDSLTGIFNRDIIENDLPKTVEEAVAAGKDACLIMVDIDYFKKVNDTYGHPTGDIVLKNTANIIERCIRKKDWVARFGGEEFLIFLPGTNRKTGSSVAERIRKEIEDALVNSNGGKIRVTASFGVASLLDDGIKAAQDLIKLADQNLYSAKESGRNMVVC